MKEVFLEVWKDMKPPWKIHTSDVIVFGFVVPIVALVSSLLSR